MKNFLDFFQYKNPNIVINYKSDNSKLRIIQNYNNTQVSLFDDKDKWISYDKKYKTSIWEIFSHYWIADGVCICTGLGFALRESWILTKKNISKLIVLEKCKELIEYHQKFNSHITDNIEIINIDANEYVGECDTLLLDHYENETNEEIIKSTKNILNNIDCKKLWLWPLELMIEESKEEHESYLDSYNKIKLETNLLKLPNLSEEELKLFVFTFLNGLSEAWTKEEMSDQIKLTRNGWYESWNNNKVHVSPEYFLRKP